MQIMDIDTLELQYPLSVMFPWMEYLVRVGWTPNAEQWVFILLGIWLWIFLLYCLEGMELITESESEYKFQKHGARYIHVASLEKHSV